MLDIKFVRENPDLVKQNIKNKFQEKKLPYVDEVIALDAKARSAKQEADTLRANRNQLSKQIGMLMKEGKKDEAEAVKAQVAADAKRLEELRDEIPYGSQVCMVATSAEKGDGMEELRGLIEEALEE